MKIKGIISEHGKDDFEMWHNFELNKEDEGIILDILSKYANDGESIRGTKEDITKEVIKWEFVNIALMP